MARAARCIKLEREVEEADFSPYPNVPGKRGIGGGLCAAVRVMREPALRLAAWI